MGRGRPSKKIAPKVPFIRTGRPVSEKIVICVVYKKPTGKKFYLNTYVNFEVVLIVFFGNPNLASLDYFEK